MFAFHNRFQIFEVVFAGKSSQKHSWNSIGMGCWRRTWDLLESFGIEGRLCPAIFRLSRGCPLKLPACLGRTSGYQRSAHWRTLPREAQSTNLFRRLVLAASSHVQKSQLAKFATSYCQLGTLKRASQCPLCIWKIDRQVLRRFLLLHWPYLYASYCSVC